MKLCLIWHFHQPDYRVDGEVTMPWVAVHALRGYTDLPVWAQAAGVPMTFNLVPVLVEQLEESMAHLTRHREEGSPIPEPLLATLTLEPDDWSPALRRMALEKLFWINKERLIARHPPYQRMAELAAHDPEGIYLGSSFFQDLSVWFFLAWMGETVRDSDPRVAYLINKGAGFDRADRTLLLRVIEEVLAAVLPRLRRMHEGAFEVAMSPGAHPILPLLHDLNCAHEATPTVPLPQARFLEGDKAIGGQLRWRDEAIRDWGAMPGCWPSEGAVDTPTLDLLAEKGVGWVATGERVLAHSQHWERQNGEAPDSLYTPHRCGQSGILTLFRDDHLSDRLGFDYPRWRGDDAVRDLIHRLEALVHRFRYQPEAVVTIALDGENPWEYYADGGRHFVPDLLKAIAAHPALEAATPRQLMQGDYPALPQVVAGSWVHGTLTTWIGDPAKNRAWELLCDARAAYLAKCPTLPMAQREVVERQMRICEGSDWFWWLGENNPLPIQRRFDALFRAHLRKLYQQLEVPVPRSVSVPLVDSAHTASFAEMGGVMKRGS